MNYGPWSPTVDRIERGKQLRSMAALTAVYLGSDHPLVAELRAAETDAMAFVRAQDLVEALPAGTRRRLLGTFSRITWPPKPRQRRPYRDDLDESEPVGKFCDLST
jgi:hypothetical protein